MSLFQQLTEYVSNTTSPLLPTAVTLPLAPVEPLSQLIQHVTSRHVHDIYFPYLRFGAIHASRVAIVWAGQTKGKKGHAVLQDLFGYLVMAWGGGTLVSLLLNQPPSWLASPTSWLIYVPIYLLLVPTGLASFIAHTTPNLVNLLGSLIDGLTRGTTIATIPTMLELATKSEDPASLWTTALLSGIAVSGGGWIVQGLGLNQAEWTIGRPSVLSGGLLDTLDLWSAFVTAIVYSALQRYHTILEPVTQTLDVVLPHEIKLVNDKAGAGPLVSKDHARAIGVIVLASLLCARVITKLVLGARGTGGGPAKKSKKAAKIKDAQVDTEVVKSPTQSSEGKVTPRKGKKAKKN